jgi:hypothetical protein
VPDRDSDPVQATTHPHTITRTNQLPVRGRARCLTTTGGQSADTAADNGAIQGSKVAAEKATAAEGVGGPITTLTGKH